MFSNVSKRTSNNNNIQMNFNTIFTKPPTLKQITKNPKPQQQPQSQPQKKDSGLSWGKHVWYFLHTLIEKVKDSHFNELRDDILKYIYIICTNLPCPMCSNHAKTTLDGMNFNSLRTKQQIKITLFNFHNLLNKQKGYPIFTESELSKYSNADLKLISVNFFNAYIDKNNNLKMMNQNMYRNMIIKEITAWFTKNYNCFNF